MSPTRPFQPLAHLIRQPTAATFPSRGRQGMCVVRQGITGLRKGNDLDRARETAARVLFEVGEKGAYANVALARELRKKGLEDVDRRFCTELVYGTVKASGTVDWILRRYTDRSLKKIDPMICAILRLGIYQLFFLERVPASAACNESVELAKKYGHGGTVKFVNAVLRSAAREPQRAEFPRGKGHATEYLALSAFHPQWLVKRWIKAFGYEECEKLCAFDNEEPVLSLRTNILRTKREELLKLLREAGAEAEASRWTPEGILCGSHGSLDALMPLQQGLCQVQDESSMLVAHIVDPQPGEFLIDCCAAPGGKTTHLAERMGDKGRILACDIYEHKLDRIRENAERLGISSVEPVLLDARGIGQRYSRQADRVLADVPCSGLGVLRRKPDLRWNKTEAELRELPALQRAILDSAAEAVKPGGILVYSTCTIERAENEDVVKDFLKDHPEFSAEQAGAFLPEEKRQEEMLQLYPQKDGTDGFFIARMRRNG